MAVCDIASPEFKQHISETLQKAGLSSISFTYNKPKHRTIPGWSFGSEPLFVGRIMPSEAEAKLMRVRMRVVQVLSSTLGLTDGRADILLTVRWKNGTLKECELLRDDT